MRQEQVITSVFLTYFSNFLRAGVALPHNTRPTPRALRALAKRAEQRALLGQTTYGKAGASAWELSVYFDTYFRF